MEATFERRETFWVLGVTERANPMTTNYKALWGRFEAESGRIGPLAVAQCAYGVYWMVDPELCDIVAGMAVAADAEVPEGLVKREVPAADYAVFETDMAGISATWAAIYGQWFAAAGYLPVDGAPCFEEFTEGSAEGRAPVRILVAVRKVG